MTSCLGVDISQWQDLNSTPQMYNPWKTRSMGGSFVGIKVTQADWVDPDFIMNWNNCKDVLYEKPYHFLTFDINPKRQAESFWKALEKNIHPNILDLTCDFEWWGSSTPPNVMDILYNFLERLKVLSSPLPLGIYTSMGFWKYNGINSDYWNQYLLWICDINNSAPVLPIPFKNWYFHQYTFKLNGPQWGAESLDLDGDYYNGTLEDMVYQFRLSPLKDSPNDSLTKKYFVPYYNDLFMRSDPDTSKPNKVGRTLAGGMNEVLEEKDANGYHWIKTSNWMATDGFGEFVTK